MINLGQKGNWLGVGAQMTAAYVDFAGRLREQHPNAHIYLALGSMDAVAPGSPFPGYLEDAVDALNADGDDKVHGVIFPYNGSGAHPVASEQAEMAEILVSAIQETAPELSAP